MSKTTSRGDAIRRGVNIAIDQLTPHPRNYKKHPAKQITRIRASLRRYGQVRSIVVQEVTPHVLYLVVAGHGVTEAAREEHMTALSADVIPASWTPQQVEGYLITDNEQGRNADDDQAMLAEMLTEQAEAGEDLATLGYDDDELQALIASLEGDAGVPTFRDYDEGVEDGMPTEMCATCGKLCLKDKPAKTAKRGKRADTTND